MILEKLGRGCKGCQGIETRGVQMVKGASVGQRMDWQERDRAKCGCITEWVQEKLCQVGILITVVAFTDNLVLGWRWVNFVFASSR